MNKLFVGIICLLALCACGESKFQKQSRDVFEQCENMYKTTNEILDKSKGYEEVMNKKIAEYLEMDYEWVTKKNSDANIFFFIINESQGRKDYPDSTKQVNKYISEYVSSIRKDIKSKFYKQRDAFLNYKQHEVWSGTGEQAEELLKLYDEIDNYCYPINTSTGIVKVREIQRDSKLREKIASDIESYRKKYINSK